TDDDFLVFFNADAEQASFTIPATEWGERWVTEIDTCADVVDPGWHEAGSQVTVGSRAVVVLRAPREKAIHTVGAATSERQG
ncbi:MAG: glycogen debranching enzyme, partial [Knoellia sp.]